MKIKKLILIFIIMIFLGGCFSSLIDKTTNTPSVNETTNTPIINNDFSNLTYVAFGDSITYGADYTKGYVQMENPYPKLITKTLNLKNHINYAISGSTIATNVDDLPSIYNQCLNATNNADIVSVMGGVNDYNRGVEIGNIDDISTDTFYGSLNSICKLLKEKYPNSLVFLMTPYKEHCYHEFECDRLNKVGYNLEDYSNAIKEVANKNNIKVLDMFNYGQYELEMYNADSDGIHPSQYFITNYTTPQIVQFIKENYKK